MASKGDISPEIVISNTSGENPETRVTPVSDIVTGILLFLDATFQKTTHGSLYPFFSYIFFIVSKKGELFPLIMQLSFEYCFKICVCQFFKFFAVTGFFVYIITFDFYESWIFRKCYKMI